MNEEIDVTSAWLV